MPYGAPARREFEAETHCRAGGASPWNSTRAAQQTGRKGQGRRGSTDHRLVTQVPSSLQPRSSLLGLHLSLWRMPLHSGLYWLDIIDHYVMNYTVLIDGLLEAVAVAWVWGFVGDVKKVWLLGQRNGANRDCRVSLGVPCLLCFEYSFCVASKSNEVELAISV